MTTLWSIIYAALPWTLTIDIASAAIGLPAFFVAWGYRKRRIG